MKSVTIEITNFCEQHCKYCSSNAVDDPTLARYITTDQVRDFLGNEKYGTIIISGGEPLAHPGFYEILKVCKQHSEHVVVYTNALEHIVYNAGVIDGVRVDVNLTVLDSTNTVKILKRVEQGRERTRPAVTFSRNFTGDCHGCGEVVLLPDGTLAPSPCRKDEKVEKR